MKAIDLAKAEPHGAILSIALLQRILCMAEGNIDLAHLDAVLAGVADDLRRCVKTHRLGIQQSAAERVGMIMLEPGRDIDELRETRGMAFRKAVAAEPFDLIEAVFCEHRIVTTPDHVSDHLGFEFADGADIAKRRHRAAQPVGFLGSKFCSLNGDTHRLFLEQRHAEGLVQNFFKLVFIPSLWIGILYLLRFYFPPL